MDINQHLIKREDILLRPPHKQYMQEWRIFTEYEFFITSFFKSYPYLVNADIKRNLLEMLLYVKIQIPINKIYLLETETKIHPALFAATVNPSEYKELEKRRADLYDSIVIKDFVALIASLSPEEAEIEYYSKFFLLIQYWILREKIFGRPDAIPGEHLLTSIEYEEQRNILQISLEFEFSNFVNLLELTRPELFTKIRKNYRLDSYMRGREVVGIAPPPLDPAKLWQGINKVVTQPAEPGARPLPTQESLSLLETFLTTPKSMSQMAKESNGLWSVAGIRKNLNTSLQRVWQDLLPQDRQGYETAQEAMQAVIASGMKIEETRRKIRENERPSWKEDKPRYHTQNARKKPGEAKRKTGRHKKAEGEPKQEFSGTHTQHLSDAASDRWRRNRAEKSQATTTPEQP